MESQIVSPFTVPPPKPTETEKIQKDYFESTTKVKDGFLKMNQLLIIDEDQKILDLENMVIDLSNKLKKIEKENKDLVKKVKKHEKQWETAHDECNKDYRDLEDDVNNYAKENESRQAANVAKIRIYRTEHEEICIRAPMAAIMIKF